MKACYEAKHLHRRVGRNASDELFRAKLSQTEKCQRRGGGREYPRRRGNGIIVKFSDGTVLKANYWRLIQDGRALLSSFDHQKKYGLPAPIDAKEQISRRLEGRICDDVQLNSETADLTLVFGETTKLQVFNFTGYEIWELKFPNGAVEYSNYALT